MVSQTLHELEFQAVRQAPFQSVSITPAYQAPDPSYPPISTIGYSDTKKEYGAQHK